MPVWMEDVFSRVALYALHNRTSTRHAYTKSALPALATAHWQHALQRQKMHQLHTAMLKGTLRASNALVNTPLPLASL